MTEDLERPAGIHPLPWWHNLMYATSILLVFCGIPGTAILAFLLSIDRRHSQAHSAAPILARSDALFFAIAMAVAELAIAGLLYALAEWLARRRKSHP